ncbi:transcription initiation factor TFIID subunit 4-like [Lontra canadensis]|uniref:transcription initiation factor TFIID subunit 4-like n=1 Tax=Lontra canadensis TaxID=76717 RepID=UPI0013F33047|nr:transcription initiation factor TFIID subunit 4-like [Lontra canadensis]
MAQYFETKWNSEIIALPHRIPASQAVSAHAACPSSSPSLPKATAPPALSPADPPPIPEGNCLPPGTALGGQLRQPASRKEADPPPEFIQSAGAPGTTKQYTAHLRGFVKKNHAAGSCALQLSVSGWEPEVGGPVCLHRILATASSKLKARGHGSWQSLSAGHSPIPNPPPAPPFSMCLSSGSLGRLARWAALEPRRY